MALRFSRPARGVLRVTVDGVTYTATHYPSHGAGFRQYWTVRTDDRPADYDNDWYEPNEESVRNAIAGAVAQRRKASAE